MAISIIFDGNYSIKIYGGKTRILIYDNVIL